MAQLIPALSGLSSFGTGLGQGLQELASRKLSQLQQREQQREFSNTLSKLGYSQDQSNLLASLPENQRLQALQSLAPSGTQAEAQQIASSPSAIPQIEQALSQLQQATPKLSGLELLKQSQQQQAGLQPQAQFEPMNAKDILEQAALQGITLTPEQQQKINNKIAAINASEELQKQFAPILQQSQYKPTQIQAAAKELVPQPLFKKQLTEAERIAQERLNLAKRKEERQEKTEAFKLTQTERKEINDKVKTARSALRDLDRLEELEKEGKLDTPGYIEMLKRSGLDIPALLNPGSEEYNKIVNNFVREAKAVYGARVTNTELEQFMKTLPSLSLSPEGRKRVIANLRYLKNADVAYGEALCDVVKENNGIPPLDLAEEIDDKVGKRLDQLSVRFKKDLSKPVPKAQNRLATALQASLGGAAGAIPGALKGAAKGAIAGSIIPGLGTGTGAILGALGGGSGLL